jgi:hypothetical protein
MPIHDWMRVSAGTFHHFHHGWIDEIAATLNAGLLPRDYYAMAEQFAGGFEPDVFTLQAPEGDDFTDDGGPGTMLGAGEGVALAKVELQPTAVSDLAFYRRKQNVVTVRDATGDRRSRCGGGRNCFSRQQIGLRPLGRLCEKGDESS